MIKKIILSSLLLCVVISCGKKGSPKYIDPSNCWENIANSEIKNICIKYKDPNTVEKIYTSF